MGLDFQQPLLLLLLPISLAFVVLIWRASRTYMPPGRRGLLLGLRLVVVTCLVLVFAGPTVHLRADEISIAFLLDRSDSINPAMRDQQERWLARALADKATLDQAAVVTFGETAAVDRALSTDSRPPRLDTATANVGGRRTNIAAALRTGLAALPPTSARRLVLLSDGRENLEQAEPTAALLAATGAQLLVVPLTSTGGTEVLVRQFDAPSQVREGDRLSATAQVDSSAPMSATLYLLVDGRLVATQEVSLEAGTNRFVLPLEPLPAGQHTLRVQVEPDDDTLVQNNAGGALVVVTGPPSVLIVEGSQGEGQYLADALRTQGLHVEVVGAASAPLKSDDLRNYAAVVLANVPATALAEGQMRALKTYVQNYGGGLVVAGGDRALGPGGYTRTPLEELLPVRMDLRGKSVSASTALMLVIDTSGSMGGGPGGASKMELAKEAAIAAAELLGEYDQIGVVAFEDQPRWAIPPTFATDLGPIQTAISELQPGGGTEIYPALKMGFEGIAPIEAKIKHIILLTDGEAPRGPYEQLAKQMEEAHVTLSTIAIGSTRN